MKLTDLEPRWFVLETGGPRVGLTFLCPHCRQERIGVVFHHRGHEAIEDEYIKARHAHAPGDATLEPNEFIWTIEGSEDFATLSLTPSVDASKAGHWHGFVTNGQAA